LFSSVVPVAKSAAGKWVSRVGASGGGKAYKKTRPSNFYAAVVVIVVLGLAATVFARFDYQHPASAAKGTPPAIGTTWYAGLSIQACGKALPSLVPNPNFAGGFTVQPSNVIRISPVSAADAGSHATLSQFAAEFPGLIASSTELAVPTATGVANPKTTYHNGDACPANSKYPGQKGRIIYAYWKVFGQQKPTLTTNPSSIKFSQSLRVAMALDPVNVIPNVPSKVTVYAMFLDTQTATTPTTTIAGATTTTSTTTTTKSTATTTKSTTTTAPAG
jgi:hypothetical protein